MNKHQIILDLLARQNERTLDSHLNALSGGQLGRYDMVTTHLLSLQLKGLIEYDAAGFCALTEAGKVEAAA